MLIRKPSDEVAIIDLDTLRDIEYDLADSPVQGASLSVMRHLMFQQQEYGAAIETTTLTIAENTGLSRHAVRSALKALENIGAILLTVAGPGAQSRTRIELL